MERKRTADWITLRKHQQTIPGCLAKQRPTASTPPGKTNDPVFLRHGATLPRTREARVTSYIKPQNVQQGQFPHQGSRFFGISAVHLICTRGKSGSGQTFRQPRVGRWAGAELLEAETHPSCPVPADEALKNQSGWWQEEKAAGLALRLHMRWSFSR